MKDWPTEIVTGVLVHQRLADLDVDELWRHHLPEVAASEDEIAATEKVLRTELGVEYRGFLRFANGWRSFFQDVDVFGTRDLLRDHETQHTRDLLSSIDPDLLADITGWEASNVLVVGASDRQADMFLMSRDPGVSAEVLWFAGQIIERFPTFDEMYLAMLDYNRRQISKFEQAS